MENINEFEKLGIDADILEVLEKKGFSSPTEIQSKAIPLALKDRDIIGGSATGSGKTLAFTIPIVQNLKPNRSVQALVLAPTRELAEQISEIFRDFSRKKKLKTVTIYGGMDMQAQIRKIPSADIIIGTPGRILDHLNRRTLNLRNVKFLVLDEVDRMFDMGFQHDVENIINECPRKRQTMLFSATISSDIDYLSKKHTSNPVEVAVKSQVDPSQLKQIFYDVPDSMKFSLLVHLLKNEKSELVIVFCSSRRNVDFLAKNLKNQGVHVNPIHGGMPQNKRKRMMEDFHNNRVDVLVCTDVAARGLDIPRVSHVYNYDIPKTTEDYIHRIGRTARAGKEGIAVNLVSSRDYINFGGVMDDKKVNIERVELPYIKKVEILREARSRVGRDFQSRGRGRNDNSRRFNDRPRERNDRRPSSRNYSRGISATPGMARPSSRENYSRNRR